MRIAVFGTGGAGGYFGARLARAGEDVTFIARGEHLNAIRERGLTVETPAGEIVPAMDRGLLDAAEFNNATSDRILGFADVAKVCMLQSYHQNAEQLEITFNKTRFDALPDRMKVIIENGVEAASQLASVLGADRVVGGLCGTLSWVVGPGRIRSIGGVHFVKIGELDNRASERVERLRRAFERAGVDVEIPSDIHRALWEKFLFVVSLGGVGAVARAPVGVLRTVPETRRMLMRCMEEILAVARAREVPMVDSIVAEKMALVDSLAPDGTTSLQRDIVDGKPSELEAWNGAVVRLGREAGVPTPLHGFLYESLLPQERRARGGPASGAAESPA